MNFTLNNRFLIFSSFIPFESCAFHDVSLTPIKINTILLRRVFYLPSDSVGVWCDAANSGSPLYKVYWINAISCLTYSPPTHLNNTNFHAVKWFMFVCSLRYQLYVTHGLSFTSNLIFAYCFLPRCHSYKLKLEDIKI